MTNFCQHHFSKKYKDKLKSQYFKGQLQKELLPYTANPVPVMKTGNPVLKFSQGTLLSLQEPVFKTGESLLAPCSTLCGIALYVMKSGSVMNGKIKFL